MRLRFVLRGAVDGDEGQYEEVGTGLGGEGLG
jgi:hypothetical protein